MQRLEVSGAVGPIYLYGSLGVKWLRKFYFGDLEVSKFSRDDDLALLYIG